MLFIEYLVLGLFGGEEIVFLDLEEDYEGNNVDYQRDYKEGNDIKIELSLEIINLDFFFGFGVFGIFGCFYIGNEKIVLEVVVYFINKYFYYLFVIFESSDCEVIVLDIFYLLIDFWKKVF